MDLRIEGTCWPRFERVRKAFEALWDGAEVGAAVTLHFNDRCAVELWGGWVDRGMTRRWERQTLVNVYSSGKGAVALAVAKLVSQVRLGLDMPVTRYWPEFAAEGKSAVTVRQLLAHQAGLCGFEPPVTVEKLYDWSACADQLAAQAPRWEPGSAAGYHPITWGYLVGEIIRRVTGQSFGEYLSEHLCDPVQADLHIGVPASRLADCAELIGPNHARVKPPHAPSPQPDAERMATGDPVIRPYADASTRQWREAEIPASNAHCTATGLARLYRAAYQGLLDESSVLRRFAMMDLIAPVVEDQPDLVLGKQLRRASGLILNCEDVFMGPNPTAFGHSGAGGSIGFADPENRIAFAYVTNQMRAEDDRPSRKLIDAVYRCF